MERVGEDTLKSLKAAKLKNPSATVGLLPCGLLVREVPEAPVTIRPLSILGNMIEPDNKTFSRYTLYIRWLQGPEIRMGLNGSFLPSSWPSGCRGAPWDSRGEFPVPLLARGPCIDHY